MDERLDEESSDKPPAGPPDSGSERPAEFDGNQFRLGEQVEVSRVGDDLLPAAIPDHEQIVSRPDGPAQTSVLAKAAVSSVVLNQAGQCQVGTEGVAEVEPPQALDEIALRQSPKVLLGGKLRLDGTLGRSPVNRRRGLQ